MHKYPRKLINTYVKYFILYKCSLLNLNLNKNLYL